MHRRTSYRGFTLIEIIVAVAILMTFVTVTVIVFREIFWSAGESVGVQEVADALREARNNSIAAKSDSVYGVLVATSSITRFVGPTYSPSSASNTVYYFEAGAYATGTLVLNSTSIVFSRLTGMPSATGTIILVGSGGESTSTITIGATGLIE